MTEKEFHEILKNAFRGESILFNLSPYWIFLYNWGIVNFSDRIVTAQEIAQCINAVQFPPIGKN